MNVDTLSLLLAAKRAASLVALLLPPSSGHESSDSVHVSRGGLSSSDRMKWRSLDAAAAAVVGCCDCGCDDENGIGMGGVTLRCWDVRGGNRLLGEWGRPGCGSEDVPPPDDNDDGSRPLGCW